jgi:hypothetical protein
MMAVILCFPLLLQPVVVVVATGITIVLWREEMADQAVGAEQITVQKMALPVVLELQVKETMVGLVRNMTQRVPAGVVVQEEPEVLAAQITLQVTVDWVSHHQ